MEITPIKTRVLQPPQDDLFAVLDESLSNLHEGDVVFVTSKVISIHQGRCVPIDGADVEKLRRDEADIIIERDYWKSPLTAINHVFQSGSGNDRSNGDGHIVRLPHEPFAAAQEIYNYLKAEYSLTDLGVIVTDSRSEPMRLGATGVAIAWWGILPLIDNRGKEDLFGREIKVERSNIVDALAAAAVAVMGETAECQPLAIARQVPNLAFTDRNTRDELFCPYAEDTFRVLYERFL